MNLGTSATGSVHLISLRKSSKDELSLYLMRCKREFLVIKTVVNSRWWAVSCFTCLLPGCSLEVLADNGHAHLPPSIM